MFGLNSCSSRLEAAVAETSNICRLMAELKTQGEKL
jgi:hypothetical protein